MEVCRLAGVQYPIPTLMAAGGVLTTDLLPGLSLDVAELLAAGR